MKVYEDGPGGEGRPAPWFVKAVVYGMALGGLMSAAFLIMLFVAALLGYPIGVFFE